MKRADKTIQKRAQLIERTAQALSVAPSEAERLLRIKPKQSFRNREGEPTVESLAALGWSGTLVDWCEQGYTIDGDKRVVSDSPQAGRGGVYVQNAASWIPVIVLDPRPGEKVLDMCAAPGGKSIHLYDLANGDIELWVNDNSFPRMKKLESNLARCGVLNYRSSLHDATKLSRHLPVEYFDKILLDAPCSGEGMMDISRAKDFLYWSPSQIRRLHSQQKQLLREAWRLLKPGGTLVYSTCTIAPEENEAVIDYAIRRLEDIEIEPVDLCLPNRVSTVGKWHNKIYDERVGVALRLKPSEYIEAFFVAKMYKTP